MSRSLATGKRSVDLAPGEVRVSKIRRDPPPAVKEKALRHPDVVDRRDLVIGILAFALSLFVIIVAFGSWAGWSPRAYTIEWSSDE